ncbi:MAG: hypothetical protein AAB486_03355 [Patescibacteria group bacterium]
MKKGLKSTRNAGKSLKRKKREGNRIEKIPLSTAGNLFNLSLSLKKQLDNDTTEIKSPSVKRILALLGLGAGLAIIAAAPGVSRLFLPRRKTSEDYLNDLKEANFSYLERTLKRLEKEKLVRINEADGKTMVSITTQGKRRILKYALEDLKIEKPARWDGRWTLISYDVPEKRAFLRDYLRRILVHLGFYPFHKSIYLHAYPCRPQVEFLREYLGVAASVRIFHVDRIENDGPFREFFGV